MRALTLQSSGFGLALLLPGAAFSGVKTHVPSPLSFATSSLRSRAPRLTPKKQPSAGPGAEAHRDRMSGPVKVFGCRPHDDGATHAGAGVRKPPREETAGGDASERA